MTTKLAHRHAGLFRRHRQPHSSELEFHHLRRPCGTEHRPDLFIAGVFPGLVCMACFIIAIVIMVWRNPELAPALPRVPMRERLVSLKTGLPIIIIFIVVIGGIYAGMFTATEGGGIGAFTTVFLALVMGRLSWSIVTNGLNDTGKTISMALRSSAARACSATS